MSSLMIFCSIILGFALIGIVHAIYNLVFCLKPSARPNHISPDFGLVTVMIPARNEEKVIEKCLRSLLRQDYPHLQVIIYNDLSTDKTGEIADRLAHESQRIEVMHGTHLPKGWVGKNHGCHQMSKSAKGNWLLFGDSDTVYEPDAITRALVTAKDHGLEFLSFMPRFDNVSFGERALLPMFYFLLFALFPVAQISRHPSPQIVAANGSFILIKQSLYESIGGHEAIKDKVLEDVLMARRIKSLGHKVGYGNGVELYSAHVYDTIWGIWEGFSKNSFALFNWNYAQAISFIFFDFLICVLPFVLILWSIYMHQPLILFVSLLTAGLHLFTMLLVSVSLKQGLLGVLAFPVSNFLAGCVVFNSMFRVATGKGLTWKGRSYER